MKYNSPTTDELERLKAVLEASSNDMAMLAELSDGRQWRKYTGGTNPRSMSFHMAFVMAARLTLNQDMLDVIYQAMRDRVGAEVTDPTNDDVFLELSETGRAHFTNVFGYKIDIEYKDNRYHVYARKSARTAPRSVHMRVGVFDNIDEARIAGCEFQSG